MMRKAIFRIRRGEGWDVRPEVEQFDGAEVTVSPGWDIGPDDNPCYLGEHAWTVRTVNGMGAPGNNDWPEDAPAWIATGDLEFEGEGK